MQENRHFNPRSPWGERQCRCDCGTERIINFNPRSPWGERPFVSVVYYNHSKDFNPRSPWGERLLFGISGKNSVVNFNPRSPWGERLRSCINLSLIDGFQSTLPVGGATLEVFYVTLYFQISIHAPRGGSDKSKLRISYTIINFNPRSPWGERPSARS